jgi:hypothetical protein
MRAAWDRDTMAAKMTLKEIIGQILIGLFLIGLGTFLQPYLKRFWAWMNRPRPLTPSQKGSLLTYIETQEQVLERLNHFGTSSKDLFLYLFQLAMMGVLLFMGAVFLYAYQTTFYAEKFLLILLLISLSLVMFIAAFVEANRISDKNINAHKETIRKNIEEARRKLKMAPYDHDP